MESMENKIKQIKWAEINLDHLVHNINEIKKVIPKDTKIAAVVKANAYGHGVLEIAETLLETGIDMLAVSSINEAIEMRKRFKKVQTLVLGYMPQENISDAIKYGVIQTVISQKQAEILSQAAESIGIGASVHIKIDTGMNRIGFKPSLESVEAIAGIFHLPNIQINGIYSHFASADEQNKSFARLQQERFLWVVNELVKKGIKIPVRHIANSAGIIDMPESYLDMVRSGIMMYGIYPSREVNRDKIKLKPVMSLKTKIAYIKTLKSDEGISYGLSYIAKKGTKVATIPVGYADGYTRSLSNQGQVLINGRKAKIIGNICMDQCMVDVTELPEVKEGDEVILFGGSDGEFISIESLAEKAGMISYEMLCMIGRRVPRVYLRENTVTKITNYLEHYE